MAQSLANILVHLVFSTKRRQKLLTADIRPELEAYVARTLIELRCPPLAISFVEDHGHGLFPLSRNITTSRLVRELKVESSKGG